MSQHNFHKILIANRGEIALRIIRAVHSLDKRAVVVHSEYDRDLPFVAEADEAYSLGSGTLQDTYLDQAKILGIAKESSVDAIHPGYGFLAENAVFAAACKENNIHFIGPEPEAIESMGDKSNARKKAKEIGLPVLEGITGDPDHLLKAKETLAYPLLIKPSAGGGGKGMRIVHTAQEFKGALEDASREAENYFGSGALYVERFLSGPRHIEVQVMADHHGNSVHLYERECSLQRRYQKIIEEAPAASISGETRDKITSSALRLVRGIGYTNAGTVEFLVDEDHSFYFLEMNTRIQVEHPVTEMITDIDLVKEQITVAEGHPLSFTQDQIEIRGHSLEARLYAEDPEKDFMPSSGRIEIFRHSAGPDMRIDTGFAAGNLVESLYDPMIAKVIVSGHTREDARNKLIRGLKGIHITGLHTNRDFLVSLLRSESFAENRIHTRFIDLEMDSLLSEYRKSRDRYPYDLLLSAATMVALQSDNLEKKMQPLPWQAIGHWRIVPEITLQAKDQFHPVKYELLKGRQKMRLRMDNRDHEVCLEEKRGDEYRIRVDSHVMHIWGTTDRSEVLIDMDGHLYNFRRPDILDERFIGGRQRNKSEKTGKILAPLNGRVVQISGQEGDEVKKGEPLLVIESMKMENKILAPRRAILKMIHVSVGDQVGANQLLFTLDPYERSTDK
jgi:3-methylcrotonyl-CoA carboxylase alpha subunit